MIFNINSMWQIFGVLLVFTCLILANEFSRRTKMGGIISFLVIPGALTIYFIILNICGACGVSWAKTNMTFTNMNSWFHYAKLYAATAGCIGFMMIKYKWGIGKYHWFKPFPFLIVAINILIAVGSDFQSAIMGAKSTYDGWWVSSEGVLIKGGWWNWVNGIAGIINIACMTGWFCVYSSKDEKDMVWPDMTIAYIIAYDIWNFEYTYNNLPTHAWYCGVALLLAPTVAAMLWNKGGWIQNRANTLATWCMFAQVVPQFQDGVNSPFFTFSSVYGKGATASTMRDIVYKINNNLSVDPEIFKAFTAGDGGKMQGFIAVIALFVNVYVLMKIVIRSVKAKHNPYTKPIWTDQKDYIEAWKRCTIDDGSKLVIKK